MVDSDKWNSYVWRDSGTGRCSALGAVGGNSMLIVNSVHSHSCFFSIFSERANAPYPLPPGSHATVAGTRGSPYQDVLHLLLHSRAYTPNQNYFSPATFSVAKTNLYLAECFSPSKDTEGETF